MNRIDAAFARLKREKRKALIVFVAAGDPDLAFTERLVPDLFRAGADIVELGIPFSDPMADGPVIQASFMRALKKRATLKGILDMTARIRKVCDGPLIYMSAFNLIFRYGVKAFAKNAAESGVDGVIFPDIIPEESGDILPYLEARGIAPVFLAAPTSGPERIKMITSKCHGFVYYVSVTGITGKQKPSAENVRRQVAVIKRHTRLPVAAGFGISTADDAAAISRVADGVIVGSALVRLLAENRDKESKMDAATAFVRSLRRAMDKTPPLRGKRG